MKLIAKIIISLSCILALIILIILLTSKTTPALYATYDKEGKLLDKLEYTSENVNVILVVFNTLRAQNVGALGYSRDTTPNIDKFSKEGILFKQAYAPWTKTTPSLVSILTGLYPHTTGITRESSQVFPGKFTSIAEILKNQGYKTFGIASNPNTGKAFNFNQGFDEFIDVVPNDGWMGDVNSKHTERETDKAIELITKNKDNKFFLYLHYLDPHGPYTPPAPYNAKFVNDKYYDKYNKSLPITNNGLLGVIPEYQKLSSPNANSVDYIISQYDGEVNYVDYNVGRLLDKIKELNLDKNTLIILMSDHGSSMGEQDYWFEHGAFAYDSLAHILLAMSYPKLLPKNKIIESPVAGIDVIPTILDLIKIPIDKNIEGKSLFPAIHKSILPLTSYSKTKEIENKIEKIHEYVFGAGGYNEKYIVTIRDKEWKFIKTGDYIVDNTGQMRSSSMIVYQIVEVKPNHFASQQVTWPVYELYNIKKDPGETTNLINQEPKIANKLMSELYSWLKEAKPFDIEQVLQRPDLDEETKKRLKDLGYLT